MRANLPREPRRFRFEHTVFFSDLAASAPWDDSVATELKPGHSGVLDEVRLQPDAWHQTVHGAMLRVVADRDADARGLIVSNEALVDATVRFRRERDLHDSPELVAWLDGNDLDGKAFIELMENQTRLGWLLRRSRNRRSRVCPTSCVPAAGSRSCACARRKRHAGSNQQGLAMVSLERSRLAGGGRLCLVLRSLPGTSDAG